MPGSKDCQWRSESVAHARYHHEMIGYASNTIDPEKEPYVGASLELMNTSSLALDW